MANYSFLEEFNVVLNLTIINCKFFGIYFLCSKNMFYFQEIAAPYCTYMSDYICFDYILRQQKGNNVYINVKTFNNFNISKSIIL